MKETTLGITQTNIDSVNDADEISATPAQPVGNKVLYIGYAAVTTTIRLRFDGRSTGVRLLPKVI